MRRSTFISATLHIAILLWAVVAWPTAKMDSAPLVAIPVEVTTPSEVTKLKAGSKDEKDEAALAAKPEEKKPEAVREAAAKPEPEPQPKPKVEQKPEAKPKPEAPQEVAPKPAPKKPDVKKAEAKKPEEKPKPKKQAEAKKPAPKPEAKRDFNTDRIAALLNKIPDADNEPEPVLPAEEAPKKVRGQSDGREMTMSVNEIDALRARIAQCWSPPPGGLGAGQIVVKLRLRLNEDGTLLGYPTIANRGASPFFQAAADSAVRAVYQCQPYTLPAEKYALWRDMILNFDPSEMYRAG